MVVEGKVVLIGFWVIVLGIFWMLGIGLFFCSSLIILVKVIGYDGLFLFVGVVGLVVFVVLLMKRVVLGVVCCYGKGEVEVVEWCFLGRMFGGV